MAGTMQYAYTLDDQCTWINAAWARRPARLICSLGMAPGTMDPRDGAGTAASEM